MVDYYSLAINVIIFFATIAAIIWAYYVHSYRYWSSRGVATIPVESIFGNIGNPRTRKHSLYESMANCYMKLKSAGHKHGGFYLGSTPFYLPLEPEQVKNILTKDFSHFVNRGLYFNEEKDPLTANLFFINEDDWRTLRVKMTPTFTSGKMKMMFQTLVDCSKPFADQIHNLISEKKPLDIKYLSGSFTTDVIGSCAFGLECNSFKNPDAEFRYFGNRTFTYDRKRTVGRILGFMFPKFAAKIGVLFIPKEVTEFFNNVVDNTIKFREEKGITRNDFMQLLLELKQNGTLKAENIAAQAFIFFIAGFETSSSTLSYCLYELAQNEEIQDKVRKEIKQVLAEHGELTFEALMDLKYMKQVIDETLRKYPVLPFLFRQCIQDYKIPDSKIVIEKGTRVCMPIYGYHMDPDNYPNPEQFNPDRFSEDNKDKVRPYTYLPFGEGPRVCIGLRFGIMQIKVGLTSILKDYKFRLNAQTPTKITWDSQSFMLQSKDLILLDAEEINSS